MLKVMIKIKSKGYKPNELIAILSNYPNLLKILQNSAYLRPMQVMHEMLLRETSVFVIVVNNLLLRFWVKVTSFAYL